MTANPVLVEALRGGVVESAHRGAWAVVDAQGVVRASVGDVLRPIFPRSAVKLLQALPLVASGAAEAFQLTPYELALTCASHNGEAIHTQAAAAMLAKAGLDPSALECGVHAPYFEAAQRALLLGAQQPTALHNNCSGKHAGFACLGSLMARSAGLDGADFLRGYTEPKHPVMREVRAALEATTGFALDTAACGVDGCSIPTYAIPLKHLALAFARVATGQGLSPAHADAAQRLRSAIAQAPEMVAGTGRFDTRVMQRMGTRVCCKVGAEGVYCAALPEVGWGLALKMDDGNNARAAEVLMAALIQRFLPLDEGDQAFMTAFSAPVLRNWRGLEVGQLRAVI